jgi:hypothetical protein
MKRWSTLATLGLVGLMAFNVAAAAYYFVLQGQLKSARQPRVVEAGSQFPVFSGVDLSGGKWAAGDAPCRVIRITNDDCHFCKKDKPSYAKLVDAARQASCEIVELAPKAGTMAKDPRPGVVQLKFVDADLGPVLAPFATPHTIIVDKNWTLKLNRRGYFTEEALSEGLSVLGSFAAANVDGAATKTARR